MKQLVYTRVEARPGQPTETVKRITTRVHKEPAMEVPTIRKLSESSWERVTTGVGMEVIERWRLLDAARVAA